MGDTAKLKIYHILLSKGFSGSERSTAESCNQQCLRHEVTLVVRKDHRRRGVSILDHLDARVNVIEIPGKWLVSSNLKRLFKRGQPDIIHTHLRRSARIVARLKPNAATLATLHINLNSPYFTELDGIICNARWQMKEIPETYQGLVLKANNSIKPHDSLDKARVSELRTELGIKSGDFLIGAVGRLHPSKAWDTLIKAFCQLDNENARLLFFGTGRQQSELKQLAGNNSRISFAGFREDIKDLYQSFDLVACPSRFEPLPRVILEAMDAGTPVLASDIGGCKELIDDYGGFLFNVDDVGDLKAKLELLAAHPPARHKPDLSAHHVENANGDIEDFYIELLKRKGIVQSMPPLPQTA